MKTALVTAISLSLVLMAGCGTRTEDGEEASAIPEYQLQSMEKAKNVEQLLLDANKQRNQE